MDGVDLVITEDALREVAKKAIERKTGARGLRAIMEDVMLNIMYDIPSEEGVKTCEITADTINKLSPPRLIREGDPQQKLSAARKTRAKAAPAVKKAE